MEKRLFQLLDEMNVEDGERGTSLVAVIPNTNFLSADKIKQGCKISIGAPESAVHDIATGKVIPILLLVDQEEYFKRIK